LQGIEKMIKFVSCFGAGARVKKDCKDLGEILKNLQKIKKHLHKTKKRIKFVTRNEAEQEQRGK
jgi:hypothetical protein